MIGRQWCKVCGCWHALGDCLFPKLLKTFRGTDPSEEEKRSLAWLAGCERETIFRLMNLIDRVRTDGAASVDV